MENIYVFRITLYIWKGRGRNFLKNSCFSPSCPCHPSSLSVFAFLFPFVSPYLSLLILPVLVFLRVSQLFTASLYLLSVSLSLYLSLPISPYLYLTLFLSLFISSSLSAFSFLYLFLLISLCFSPSAFLICPSVSLSLLSPQGKQAEIEREGRK